MNNNSNFWFGFTLFFGSILLLVGCYKFRELQENGVPVKMTIQAKKYSNEPKRIAYYRVTFYYQGEQYVKYATSQFYGEHLVGDVVDMKYVERLDYALFPDERVSDITFAIFGIILLIGFRIMVVALLKKSHGIKRKAQFATPERRRRKRSGKY
jgi:hypothetical protein